MKKHWFLIAILGTLIGFTACKKDYENRITGTWEILSVEGSKEFDNLDLEGSLMSVSDDFFTIHPKNIPPWVRIVLVAYKYSFTKNNKITFENFCLGEYRFSSVKVSFSGERMIWKDKNAKLTFKKISK